MSQQNVKDIISWITTIVCAVVFALFVNNFIIVNAYIPSGSMKNTIMEKSRVVAFRFSYLFKDIERFEVVVFEFPDDVDKKTLFVKRVIGLPGETVRLVDGKVYINDEEIPLEDSFAIFDTSKDAYTDIEKRDNGTFVVPEDSYFMMGDNRNDSHDSRFWDNTYVVKDKVLGKAMFMYFPKMKGIK